MALPCQKRRPRADVFGSAVDRPILAARNLWTKCGIGPAADILQMRNRTMRLNRIARHALCMVPWALLVHAEPARAAALIRR